MENTRYKDVAWRVGDNGTVRYEGAQLAVLMDLRDELKKLNLLLHCSNFTAIPFTLMAIREQTKKPRKKRRKKVAPKSRRAA